LFGFRKIAEPRNERTVLSGAESALPELA